MNSTIEPIQADLIVVGGGPGGYAAAFYAADKGRKVILIEQDKRLGGVCLNRGCIPSKALLHAAKMIDESKQSAARGISFGEPRIEIEKLRAWKEGILTKLSTGITSLAQRRGVEVIYGRGHFEEKDLIRVETPEGQKFIRFKNSIIAVGSKSALPKAFDLGNPRIMTSRQALELQEIPESLLVVGGGYIGMELGTVYANLGSKVVVVEAMSSILMGADPDLARPVMKYAETHFKEVRLDTKVSQMSTSGKQIKVVFEKNGEKVQELYDRVLIAVGRTPNCADLGLENANVEKTEKGFIKVNDQQQTSNSLIYAIGDVVGGAMLAHKASKEARIAVEALSGAPSRFKDIIIPAVVFTDPEVAWCGITEQEARQKELPIEVVRFPWSASGRALTFDRTDGVTKIIVDRDSERIIGVGICGHGAGELIAEGAFAIEMGATIRDLAETVHPHPTLSETLMECAEMFYGSATHAFSRKKKA